MTKLVLDGKGGAELDPKEMLSDELIGLVEGLNPNLGTEKDPYFQEYTSFMNEINSLGIVTIDADSMTNGRFDDMDLSGKEEETKEIPDSAFVFDEPSEPEGIDLAMFALAFLSSPFDGVEEDGYVFAGGVATPFGGDVVPQLTIAKK